MRKLASVILCIVFILLFGACSSNTSTSHTIEVQPKEKTMTISEAIKAAEAYHVFDSTSGDYATAQIHSGYSDTAEKLDKIDRLNRQLGFTGGLKSRMDNTRPLDGTQTEENENYKVTWSFDHPYFNITYEMK